MESSGDGEDRFLKHHGQLAFFFGAARGLSYSSWLKACIVGLVFWLVPCHTSATGLTHHGWRILNCQKHAFGGEGLFDIAKPGG